MCESNNCSQRYNMYLISLFDNSDEHVNTLSPAMQIFVPCSNHHRIYLSLTTKYPLLSLLAPVRIVRDCFTGGQAPLISEDPVWWSADNAQCKKRKNLDLEGVIEVTFCILDPDVMTFRLHPLVGIGEFYIAIRFQTLTISNGSR